MKDEIRSPDHEHLDEFQRRLHEALDARREPERDPWIAEQVRRDPECRELLAGYSTLLEGLARSPCPVPSADLADRVLAELMAVPVEIAAPDEQPATISILSYQRVASWVALAAALLLVAFGLWRSRSHPDPVPAPGSAPDIATNDADNDSAPGTVPPPHRPPVPKGNRLPESDPNPDQPHPVPLDALAEEFRSRSWLLAEETQESFSEVALLLPTMNRTQGSGTPAAEPRDRPLIDQFREGLSPVTTGVGPALDYLWNALPESGEDPTS